MRITFAVAAIVLAGCAAPAGRMPQTCPGKKDAAEAAAFLELNRRHAGPIRASGQCLLQYRLGDKEHRENFPVKLWLNPPDEIYLQGDVAFDAAGLVLGSNRDEFWLWLRPKEISSYWWGRWSQGQAWDDLAVSPAAVLEAFGAVNVRDGVSSLTREGRFDVLTLRSEKAAVVKRVYIEPCNYVAAKVEHFDSAGRIAARAEFAGHQEVAEGFFVPARIKMVALTDDGENSAQITLASIKPAELSAEQQQRLFVRPEPSGFEHIYQIINGAAVEQMHK